MKVVICGAGQVGTSIARPLAGENNDVTLIDQNPDLIRKISDTLDVRAIVGMASIPSVLEQAGTPDADMLIAVTYSDEVNMVACQVAHSLFDVPTKIARVRQQEYLKPIWADLYSRENMPIDFIISPEVEVARAVGRRLRAPGSFDMMHMAEGRVSVVGVRCDENCPLLDTPLRQVTALFSDLRVMVLCIIRNEKGIVPGGDDQILAGDEVYFVCDSDHLARTMASFGHEEQEARSVVIVGGGNIGLKLAQDIEEGHPGVSAKVIEFNAGRAKQIAQSLEKTVVLNGDALDGEILEEADITGTETFVAVSNDDEVNIIGSLLAKRYGVDRTVALINKNTYSPLIQTLGIDAVVDPKAITVSSILQHVRRGRIKNVYSVREDFGEIIEAEAMETSSLVGKSVKAAKLPSGVIIGLIIRGEEMIKPKAETVIEADDRIILFSTYASVKKVEKLFSVRLDFF